MFIGTSAVSFLVFAFVNAHIRHGEVFRGFYFEFSYLSLHPTPSLLPGTREQTWPPMPGLKGSSTALNWPQIDNRLPFSCLSPSLPVCLAFRPFPFSPLLLTPQTTPPVCVCVCATGRFKHLGLCLSYNGRVDEQVSFTWPFQKLLPAGLSLPGWGCAQSPRNNSTLTTQGDLQH